MARLLCRHVRRKRRRTVFNIPAMRVERRQLGAQVNNQDVHKTSATRSAILFARVHQRRAESALLARRIDRQESQVSPFTAQFHVNTTAQTMRVLGDKKRALGERTVDFIERDAVAVDKETFGNSKGGVDYGRDLFRVSGVGDANFIHDWDQSNDRMRAAILISFQTQIK